MERSGAAGVPAAPATLSHEAYLSSGYVPALDAVRAISVLAVMTYHARGGALAWLHGGRGVEVFFLLSGYLITTLSLREEARRGRLDVISFFLRRTFRIMPLYVVVLLGYVVLVLVLGFDDRTSEFRNALPWFATYLQEVPIFHGGPQGVPFGVSWSLGVEEKFYLVWPLLAFVALRGSSSRPYAAAALGVVFVLAGVLDPHGSGPFLVHYASILLGAVLAFVLHQPGGYARLRGAGRPTLLVPALVVVAGLWLVPLPDLAPFVPVPTQLGFLIPWAVVLVGLVTAGPWSRRLAPAALVHIGRLSYAFYLVHQLCLQLVARLLPGLDGLPAALIQIAIALPLTLVVCEVLHRTIERPLIRKGRELSVRRMAASPTPAAPTPRQPEAAATTGGAR